MRSRRLRTALHSPRLPRWSIRKVHWACEWVELYPGDESSVNLVYVVVTERSFGPSGVVAIGLVEFALCERRLVGEVQASDRYLVSFVVTSVNQLECFLHRVYGVSMSSGGRRRFENRKVLRSMCHQKQDWSGRGRKLLIERPTVLGIGTNDPVWSTSDVAQTDP